MCIPYAILSGEVKDNFYENLSIENVAVHIGDRIRRTTERTMCIPYAILSGEVKDNFYENLSIENVAVHIGDRIRRTTERTMNLYPIPL
mmetsp:Transcript_28473/g.23533  ORF Transcript_28473/g.23533 Transcript_28473/m.23533 type:complete len:89 (-) Transcript_28473:105-371(-)